MLSTSLLTPDESVANQFFLPQNIFFLKIVAMRKKNIFWRECCQPLMRVLPTNFFATKYIFLEIVANQLFCGKQILGQKIGWQHSHAIFFLMATILRKKYFGAKINFDATKMVCTKK